jgi:tetratricopeptide (TPR) repeat protein
MAAARRGGGPAGPRTFPTDALDFRVPLREAVRAYGALLTREGVGAEAQLHLGAIEISLDEPDVALPHLDAALQGASDPVMQYAVQFYRAAALTRLGQVQDAEIAFRAALGVYPHAESATVGLAWLLALNQHRAEASVLVAGELAAASSDRGPDLATVLDPLAIYALGDARLWDADIRQLRAALAKPLAQPPSKPPFRP